jgi:hypothetical protein
MAQLFSTTTGVPVLRSSAKSAASRPGHEGIFHELDSNSQTLAFSRRGASWAFSLSPLFEGRRNAERRASGNSGRSMFPALGKQRPRKRLPTFLRSVLSPGPRFRGLGSWRFRAARLSPSSQLRWQTLTGRTDTQGLPSPCLRGTSPGPHQPSGCPSGQLSLCPTSVTPLEAPLTGQDGRTIKPPASAGIGIHSQVRERRDRELFVARVSEAKPGTGLSLQTQIPDIAPLIRATLASQFSRAAGAMFGNSLICQRIEFGRVSGGAIGICAPAQQVRD